MKQFEDLKPYEYKEMMEKLNEKLNRFPPTEMQTRYYEFSQRYKGYEFVDVKSGRVLSKYQMWLKFNGDHKKINRAIIGYNIAYEKRLKVDWVINANGETERVKIPRKRD